MRLITLFVAALAVFAPFTKSESSSDDEVKIDFMIPVQPVEPTTTGARKRRIVSRKNQANTPLASSSSVALQSSSNQISAPVTVEHIEPTTQDDEGYTDKRRKPAAKAKKGKAKSVQQVAVAAPALSLKEELISLLDNPINAKADVNFIVRIENIGIRNIPVDEASDILVASIRKGKDNYTKYLIGQSVKLDLSTSEKISEAVAALNHAFHSGKTEFLSVLIDSDPHTSVKLFKSYAASPNGKNIVEPVKTALLKPSVNVDPDAINIVAEGVAEAGLIDLIMALLEADILPRMISTPNLVKVLSDVSQSTSANYSKLLLFILNDRLITPPCAKNILIQAAEDNSMDFIDAVEPNLRLFPWSIVIKALDICLKKRHYYIADILLRTNTHDSSDYAFRLCNRDTLIDSIAKYSNSEVLSRFTNAFYYNNTTLLLSDDSLKKICVQACYAGNVEVVDFFISNNYFNLSTRFEGKTILRMALESGQVTLAKYLIKQYGADIIFDSNTPDYNPAQFGGDALIYVAVNEQIDTFKYLLKLGSNPNAVVRYDDTSVTKLVYWAIEHGQDLIVKALLNAGCDIDFGVARTYAYDSNPAVRQKISDILTETARSRVAVQAK